MNNLNQQTPSSKPLQSEQPNQVTPSSPNFPSPSKTFIILIIIILVAVAGVGGFILGVNQNQIIQTQTQPVIPTTRPSPTPTTTTSPAPNGEMTNWKTYRNEEYGYEVKHPPNLIDATVKPNVAVFSTKVRNGYSPGVAIYVYENPNEVSLERWCDEANQDYLKESICNDIKSPDPTSVLISKVKVNELDILIRNVQTGFLETYYTFSHGKYVFDVSDSYFSDIDEARQMLSTFKFTN